MEQLIIHIEFLYSEVLTLKKRNNIIFIFVVIIVVIGTILLIVNWKNNDSYSDDDKISEEEKEKRDDIFYSTIDETIKAVNELNVVLQKENLELTNDVDYEGDFTCYEYIGDNTQYYIEKIRSVYQDPFGEYSNFKVLEQENNEKLYVCYLESCNVQDINDYSLVVDEANEKSIDTGNGIYTLNYDGETWKFAFPVINCSNN